MSSQKIVLCNDVALIRVLYCAAEKLLNDKYISGDGTYLDHINNIYYLIDQERRRRSLMKMIDGLNEKERLDSLTSWCELYQEMIMHQA